MDRVVTMISAVYIVPDMRHSVLCKVIMIAAWNSIDRFVIAACGYKKEVRFLAALPAKASGSARCRADSSHISEQVGALHTNIEGFASAH